MKSSNREEIERSIAEKKSTSGDMRWRKNESRGCDEDGVAVVMTAVDMRRKGWRRSSLQPPTPLLIISQSPPKTPRCWLLFIFFDLPMNKDPNPPFVWRLQIEDEKVGDWNRRLDSYGRETKPLNIWGK